MKATEENKGITPEAGPAKPDIPKRLYKETEAAIYMGFTLWQMRELRYKGKIDFVPKGRFKFYDIKDLDSWISSNKTRNVF